MGKLEPRYTTKQVAAQYGVRVPIVQKWVREGRITALNIGGARYGPYVFRPADLEALHPAAGWRKGQAGTHPKRQKGGERMEALEPRYTTEQVAVRYCVKISTVQRWVREGRITALNIGGTRFGPYVFRLSDLDVFEASIERAANAPC